MNSSDPQNPCKAEHECGEMRGRDRRILKVPGSVGLVYAVTNSKEERKTPFQSENGQLIVIVVGVNFHS